MDVLPKTQEACCQMAARAAVKAGLNSGPEFLDSAASGLASGLFGPAFKAADFDQRDIWIAMCREALIEANDEP